MVHLVLYHSRDNGNRYWLAMFFSGILWLAKRGAFVNWLLAVYPPKKGALPRCLSCGLVFTFPGSKSTCWREKQIRSKIDWYKKPPQKKVNAVVAWWFYWTSSRNKGFRQWWASKMCAMPTLNFYREATAEGCHQAAKFGHHKPATTPMGGWEDPIAG